MSAEDPFCYDEEAARIVMLRPEVREYAAGLETGRRAALFSGVVREMIEHPDRYEAGDLLLVDSYRGEAVAARELSLFQAVSVFEAESWVAGRYHQIMASEGGGDV